MNSRAKLMLFALLYLSLSSPVHAQNQFQSDDEYLSNLIQTIKPCVVGVGSYYFNDLPKAKYLGTGFIIEQNNYVVTNYHVISSMIKEKKTPYLRIFHKEFVPKGYKAEIVIFDEFHDLAILEYKGKKPSGFKIDDSSKLREGYRVGFTGYPIGLVLGMNPTTHTGIISSISPVIKPSPTARIIDGEHIKYLNNPYDIIQIDATAYPGNSGSPVYRLSTGKVVGVINKVFIKSKKEHVLSDPSGITYAIPSNFITKLLKSIPNANK
jgi:S1-C subfamily serine protease